MNGHGGPNYILSYTTTLDPITDTESITSINHRHQQQQQQQHNMTNDIPLEEWKRQNTWSSTNQWNSSHNH